MCEVCESGYENGGEGMWLEGERGKRREGRRERNGKRPFARLYSLVVGIRVFGAR